MNTKLTLDDACYTIENNKIVEHTLRDFDYYIENAADNTYNEGLLEYCAKIQGGCWGVFSCQNEALAPFKTFDTEEEARDYVTARQIDDILRNGAIIIYTDKKDAEADLVNY